MNRVKATIKSETMGVCELTFNHAPVEVYPDKEVYLEDVASSVIYMVNEEFSDDFAISSFDVISVDTVPELKVLVLDGCNLVLESNNLFVS